MGCCGPPFGLECPNRVVTSQLVRALRVLGWPRGGGLVVLGQEAEWQPWAPPGTTLITVCFRVGYSVHA
jgi:hypothetical protein